MGSCKLTPVEFIFSPGDQGHCSAFPSAKPRESHAFLPSPRARVAFQGSQLGCRRRCLFVRLRSCRSSIAPDPLHHTPRPTLAGHGVHQGSRPKTGHGERRLHVSRRPRALAKSLTGWTRTLLFPILFTDLSVDTGQISHFR
jgi:hypothetical protein